MGTPARIFQGLVIIVLLTAFTAAGVHASDYALGNLSRVGTNWPSSASEPTIAVGPLQVLTQSQGRIAAFTKDGLDTAPFTEYGQPVFEYDPFLFYGLLDDWENPTFFVDGVDAGCSPLPCLAARDPLMMFDPVAQRFYALAWSWTHLNLNVSVSEDLKDGWYRYHIPTGVDRPSLGFTTDKIFISALQWGSVLVLDKQALLSGQAATVPHVFTWNGVPGTHYDVDPSEYTYVTTGSLWSRACANLSATADGYLIGVASANGSTGTFKVGELTGEQGNPGNPLAFQWVSTTGAVTLRNPIDAHQKDPENPNGWSTLKATQGGTYQIISNPFSRNGSITIATHQRDATGTVNEVRVFEITASSGAVTTDETYGQTGVSYAYPSAVTDADGNLFVGFNASSETMYPSCYITGRKSGEMSLEYPPTLIKAGTGAYQVASGRWGDFTGISLNECSPSGATAYYVGQWGEAGSPDRLATWVANFRYEDPYPATCSNEEYTWHSMSATVTQPSPRWDASVTWDPVNNRVVVFGGFDGTNYLNDVWVYTPLAKVWTQYTPGGTAPSPRHRHSAVYDSARQRIVIFGGEDASNRFNDVFELSLSPSYAWSEIQTTGGPPSARSSHVAVYDSDRDQMVIEGGVAWSPYHTWSLSFPGNQWTLMDVGASPLGIEGCSAIYDPVGERMIVFGGRTYVTAYCPSPWLVDLDEVYSLPLGTGGDWTPIYPSGSTPERAYASAVYDPQCHRMLVYGGINDQVCGSPCGEDLEHGITDISALDLTTLTWSQVDAGCYGPTPRGHLGMAFDPVTTSAYAFGGGERTAFGSICDPTYHNDVWRLELPDVTAPAAVTDLTPMLAKYQGVVQWTAPGDDGNEGRAARYDVRYSTSPITAGNFASATPFYAGVPGIPGTEECADIDGLSSCTWYYFALKTRDDRWNWSPISNLPSFKSQCKWNLDLTCANLSATVGVGDVPGAPALSVTSQNPVRSELRLNFAVPASSEGTSFDVDVFDVQGRRVARLSHGRAEAGFHDLSWDLVSENGTRVKSGVYFIHMTVGQTALSQKVLILR